jgi:hypothetical protein
LSIDAEAFDSDRQCISDQSQFQSTLFTSRCTFRQTCLSQLLKTRLYVASWPSISQRTKHNQYTGQTAQLQREKQNIETERNRVSELHLTRLCRTEPVAPALPCADLVGAASRRRVLKLCTWRPFIPSQKAERLHTTIPVALRAHKAVYW